MSHRLKKKDSPVSLAFAPGNVECLLKKYEELKLDIKEIKDCISCIKNGKDQLGQLKELNVSLIRSISHKDGNCLIMLCEMYVKCVSKHPLRRKLASIFQLLGEALANFFDVMAALLRTYLNFKENVDTNHLRDMVELIAALMENFPAGDEVVQKNHLLIFAYLKDVLLKFQTLYRTVSSPIHQTDILHHVHVTFKTILLALNKCGLIPEEINEKEGTFKNILKISVDVVIDEAIVLDCRASAAMVITAILSKRTAIKDFLLGFNANFHQIEWSVCFYRLEFNSLFLSLSKPSVELVLLNALLTKLPTNMLIEKLSDSDSSTLFELFICRLIKISASPVEKSVLVLSFKGIVNWIEIAIKLIQVEVPINLLLENVLPHLVAYVDHHIDTVRHCINEGIKKSFQLLVNSNNDNYIFKFMTNILLGDLKSRGKICIMIILVDFIQVEEMLKLEKNLPGKVMNLLADVDLSSHACNLYKVLSEKHLTECIEKSRWIHLWTENVYEYMIGENKEIKTSIVEYIIPNLLVTYPRLLKEFIDSMNDKMTWPCMRISLVLIKSARAMKNVTNDFFDVFSGANEEGKWKNLLQINDMKMCLTHLDQQIRLDTLSLICSSSKTTDPVTSHEVALLQHFLHFNMAVEDASFRHQMVTEFKKLFLRMFGHAYKIEKNSQCNQYFMKIYSDFLYWFVKYIVHKLYASAPYCQISLSLQLLSLLTNVFDANRASYLLSQLKITQKERIDFTNILLKCFEDTYDPNRLLAFNIVLKKPMFTCTPSTLQVIEIFRDGLKKLYSPQPDTASIAAYYLTFIALDPDLSAIASALQNVSIEEYLTDFFNTEQVLNGKFSSTPLLFAHLLLFELKKQICVMKSSLIKGSQNAPLYGTLYSLRLLFQFSNWNSNHKVVLEGENSFSRFLEDLIDVCLEIITIVSPYVTSQAPEGHLCDVSLVEVFQKMNIGDVPSIELQSQVARMILVCCWRSMKEVSLLIGILVSSFSSDKCLLTTEVLFLNKNTVNKIWDMFCNILLRSKHAGAYELASLGFMELCSVLWMHKDPDLECIPRNALISLITDLVSQSLSNKTVQVTRRSAGIPFFLQAICNTEPVIKAKFTLKFLMSSLTEFCLHKVCFDINNFVVAVNILRSFYKDTKLAEDIYPYVANGVIIAIQGFSSACWAVCNSCTLLFSSLMQRIFGVKKSKMTGREFFSRFPTLYPFLLEKAKSSCRNTMCKPSTPNATMFPLLLLLSHLYPSVLEGSEAIMKLTVFIPYVMSCGSSPVYKTRTLAANALIPLVPLEQAEEITRKIILELKKHKSCQKVDQNFMHGSLLQIQGLLNRIIDPQKVVEELFQLLWILEGNYSLICKISYIETLKKTFYILEKGDDLSGLVLIIQNTVSSSISTPLIEQPGLTLYLFNIFSFLIKVQGDESTSQVWKFLSELFASNNHDLQMLVIEDLMSKDVPKEFLSLIMNLNGRLKMMPEILSLLMENQNQLTLEDLIKLWGKFQHLKATFVRENMRSSLLKLTGAILRKLDQNCDNKWIFKELWEFAFESSCVNQCETSRKGVAEILSYQMFESSFYGLDKSCFYRFLGCCINLLRDNDAGVRQIAAMRLFDHTKEKNYIPQAQVVMEDVEMHIFRQLEHDLVGCFEFIISTVFQSDLAKEKIDIGESTHTSDVLKNFVVFEEGKLNPYFDDCNLTERLVTLLMRHLTEANVTKNREQLLHVLLVYKPADSLINIYYEQLYQCVQC